MMKINIKKWAAGIVFTCLSMAVIAMSSGFVSRAADGRDDALDKGAYNEFGLPVNSIEPFETDENNHPLKDYKPAPKTWLYMSYLNKTSANKGQYALFDTMKFLTAGNATLTDKNQKVNGSLDKNPIIPYKDNASLSKAKIVGKNAVALSNGMDENTIVEMNLYYKETGTFSKTYESGFFFNTQKKKGSTYVERQSDIYNIKGGIAFKNLDSRAAAALTAMAAVDFDGDGVDELAVYTPYFTEPCITLYKQKDDTGRLVLEKTGTILLNDLNFTGDPNQYRMGYGGNQFPIVQLTAASLAGPKEHLVINVCPPANITTHVNIPALAVYSVDGNTVKQEYMNYLEYTKNTESVGESIFFRYASAVQADVDGDRKEELVIAGYNNTVDRYLVNMLTYDNGSYKMVHARPLEVKSSSTEDFEARKHFAMSEAVPLQAAKLKEASDKDYIFLAGQVLEFKPGSGALALTDGTFDSVFTMDLSGNKWGDYHFVSNAAAGYFALDKSGSEQLAVVWQSYSKKNNVTMNISWIWAEGTGLKQHNTNEKYLYQRGAIGYGSSIILCPVSDVKSAAYYKYQGKNFGWSAPQALAAVPAMPYWGELGDEGKPTASFTISSARTTGAQADVSLQGGVTIGGDFAIGVGMLGNGGGAGAGIDVDAEVGALYQYSHSYTKGQERTVTVDADKDSVVVVSVPVVVYHYKRYVPETVVTQQIYDDAVKEFGTVPCYDDDPGKPMKVGDVIKEGWYDTELTAQYDEVYNSIYLDEYNKLCDKYSTADVPLDKIDMSKMYNENYRPGDPSTYPSDKADIKTLGKKWSVIGPVSVTNNVKSVELKFNKENALSSDFSVHLTVAASIYGQLKGKWCFGADIDLEGHLGIAGTLDVVAGNVSVTTKGEGIAAQLTGPPTGKTFYSFQASLAAWNGAWGEDTLLMIGALADARKDIPLPPENPYVYDAGTDMVLLGWEKQPEGTRTPDSYNIYQGQTGGSKTLIGTASKDETIFLVSGLSPDQTYTFYFTGVKQGLESEYSRPLTVRTKSAGSMIQIPADKPQDQYVDEGGNATFDVSGITVSPEYSLEYQWYRYVVADAGSHMGDWEKIEGKTSETLTLSNVAKDQDNSKYRLEVRSLPKTTIGTPVPHEIAYSKAATLHVGADTRASCEVTGLSHKTAGGEKNLVPLNGTYYITKGQLESPVKIHAQIRDKDGNKVTDGTVTFMYRKDKGTAAAAAAPASVDTDGKAEASWTPGEEGDYEIAAVYEPAAKDILAMSEPVSVGAGNLRDSFYAIQYVTGDGRNARENPLVIGKQSPSVTLLDASRDYYTFEGWYTEPDGGGTKVTELVPGKIAESLGEGQNIYTLYADWKPLTYTVTYEYGSVTGTPVNPNAADYTMENQITLKDAELAGYEFKGWYMEDTFEHQVHTLPFGNEDKDKSSEVTLYAKWELIEYPITYHINGSARALWYGNNFPYPPVYTVEDLPIKIDDPKDTQRKYPVSVRSFDPDDKIFSGENLLYEFTGWHINGSPGTEISSGMTGPVTVEMKSDRLSAILYINAMGGTLEGSNAVFIASNSRHYINVGAKKKGFVFEDWYKQYDYMTGEYREKVEDIYFQASFGDTIWYAKYAADPDQVLVKYCLNDGDNPDYLAPDSYTVKGDLIDRPMDPNREGYTFTGWYKEKECKNLWDFDKDKVPEDYGKDIFTLYAGWKGGDNNPDGGRNPDEEKTDPKEGEKGSAGQTGDTSAPLIWGMIIILAGAGIVIIVRKKKKN